MFNLGQGESTVLLLLGVIFLGPRRLPELVRETPLALRRLSLKLPDWTAGEWALAVAPVLLAAAAVALSFHRG